ncbi:MAG: extracellular solute-binding protein, partial [Candidatus Puniceispirillaceae bacterium]
MKNLRTTVVAATLATAIAAPAFAAELTIAIVNNGHMINMQKVAEAYTADTGVKLNWVALEEGVLREQVTSDTATSGGQYDIINIGMQEAPIWGAAGWIEPLNFGASYDVDDMLPAIRNGLSHEGTLYAAPFYGESSMVMYRKDLTDAAGVKIADND